MLASTERPCEEATIRSVKSERVTSRTTKSWVLAATILGSSIAYIDGSIVNVALPAMETELATSVVVIQWLVNAYTLCLSVFLLIGGSAGDLYGRRRVFLIGTVIFALASLWCGLSSNVGQLIFARAIQGLGAALLIPCSLAIIGATFDESERGRAIGTWAGASAVARAVGPILGGWIVDHVTWRWIFLVNPVLALPTIWIVLYRLPESRDEEAKGGLDWRGSLLALVSLGSIAFGLISAPVLGWGNAWVLLTLLGGLLALGLFIWEESRSQFPMLPLGLFRSRTFSAVNLLTLFLYAALSGTIFFLPFALIQVEGFSATLAGTALLPMTLIMASLSRWSGGLLDRFGARWPLMIGPTVAAIGIGLLAWPVSSGSYLVFLFPITLFALGMVVTVVPLTTTVINVVPNHQTGLASGISNAVSSVASLLAIAILGAIALGVYNRTLDKHLEGEVASSEVRRAIELAKGQFVIAPALSTVRGDDRRFAENIIKKSLTKSIRLALLISALLALAAAASGALLPRSAPRRPNFE
jgi:EmrB/QacA subfamily drug resistance transporter